MFTLLFTFALLNFGRIGCHALPYLYYYIIMSSSYRLDDIFVARSGVQADSLALFPKESPTTPKCFPQICSERSAMGRLTLIFLITPGRVTRSGMTHNHSDRPCAFHKRDGNSLHHEGQQGLYHIGRQVVGCITKLVTMGQIPDPFSCLQVSFANGRYRI